MTLKKFQADQLFTGSTMLSGDHVLITDEHGVVQEIVDKTNAGDGVRKVIGILCPGLINCHCHLELSHMKGRVPEKTGLVDFVFKVVTQRHFAEDEILDAILKAEDEMHMNGIVAVGDICNNTLTLPQKMKGRIRYYNFIEASGWLHAIAEDRFRRSKSFYDQYSVEMQSNSMVPHAPYSVSAALWQHLTPYFQNKVVSIHNQETAFEDEFFIKGSGDFLRMYEEMKIDNSHHQPSGKTSLQSYFQKLSPADVVLLVHNTFTTRDDIQFAIERASNVAQQLYWCLCINANKYIEDKIPPVVELLQENANIVLGTDSLASNRSLNILDEIKTLQDSFPSVQLEQILTWATINGAQALNMANKLGSFDKGKQPGVVNLSTDLSGVKRLI